MLGVSEAGFTLSPTPLPVPALLSFPLRFFREYCKAEFDSSSQNRIHLNCFPMNLPSITLTLAFPYIALCDVYSFRYSTGAPAFLLNLAFIEEKGRSIFFSSSKKGSVKKIFSRKTGSVIFFTDVVFTSGILTLPRKKSGPEWMKTCSEGRNAVHVHDK